MPDVDDIVLLREYVDSNSESAFAGIVQRHINLVYSVALRFTNNSGDAQDVTQAVFIILAKKAAGLYPKTILTGWLYETARFTAMNFLTNKNRRQAREQEAYMQSALNDAETETIWPQILPLLENAMSRLNENDRTLVALRFFENRNLAETAAVLGINEWAARKRLERVLEKLRAWFSKRGVNSTAERIAGAISANSVHAAPIGLAKTISSVALAKGAVASISTLTLTKGALKVMAWSKTKTTIVGVAIALLGIGGTTVVVDALLPVPDIQGSWVGMLNIAPAAGYGVHKGETPRYPLILRIARVNGSYQLNVDDLGFGNQEQLATLTYKYPSVLGHSTMSDRNFVGTVDRSGKKMTGKILQLPGNTVVATGVFMRTNNPPAFPEPLAAAEFAPRAGSDLQGFWVGKIGGGKSAVDIQIKIAEASDGTFRADFYSQGTVRQPTTVGYDGTTIKLIPMNGYGMFEGRFRNGTEMIGDWIQGGYHTRTTLIQTNYYQFPGAK